MKRALIALAIILGSFAALAEEPAVTTKEFRSKVFEVHNQSPRDLANSLKLLGSGFAGSGLTVNEELRTITVRDFPENIATIEEALKRLDRPATAAPDAEVKISILVGSKTPATGTAVPDDLAPVVKELQATLRYSSYTLMTTNVHHTTAGRVVEGSGVIEPAALGYAVEATKQGAWPLVYSYTFDRVSLSTATDRPSMTAENFRFSLRFPMGSGTAMQYQNVGFNTPVTVRDGEKVVIGTTTMGDRAVIVVVTAKIGK